MDSKGWDIAPCTREHKIYRRQRWKTAQRTRRRRQATDQARPWTRTLFVLHNGEKSNLHLRPYTGRDGGNESMPPKLTKEENELYMKIVKQGNMDDMFDFGYIIGRERFAQEQLDTFFPLKNNDK